MKSDQKPKQTIGQKIWETIVSFHYYIAAVIILVSGVEFFYKKEDKEGIITIVSLLFAITIEWVVIYTSGKKHASEVNVLKNNLEGLEQSYFDEKQQGEKCNKELISELNVQKKKSKNLILISHLNNAFNEIRGAERENQKTNDEHRFIEAFSGFCNTLNTGFTEVTGKEFHVCIKVIIDPGNLGESQNLNKLKKCKVKTLIRDGYSLSTRTSKDKSHTPHLIKDNTDFNQIVDTWNTKQKPFISNNLISLKDYSNSRFIDLYETSKNLYDKAPSDEKEEHWPLPYKSCITAAIGFTTKNKKGIQIGTIIGFLCIDSKEKNVFDEEIHPLIIAGCAEGLFNSLYEFLKTYKIDNNVSKKPQSTGQRSSLPVSGQSFGKN